MPPRALGVAPEQVRFIAPDVGGGFGAKNFIYPEHALMLWAAKRVGRPVKWIASRSEVFLADHQGRDHQADATLALDADGPVSRAADRQHRRSRGLSRGQRRRGADLPICASAGHGLRDPGDRVAHRRGFHQHRPPLGVLRGPGYAEMVNILERMIDKAAAQTGIERAELRRRNLAPAAMPATNVFGNTIDSGAFSETFDAALQDADVGGFAERRRGSEASGKRRGLGFAYHIKATGGSPYENVDIRFEENGAVALITGTQTIGQGHETTFPQILADRLGVPNDRIRLCQGDTDLIPAGGGHGSSRATYMGGTAIWRASDIIIEKGRRIAAEALEAAEADPTFADGRFVVAGTDRAIELFEVARLGREAGAPLDTFYGWTREHMTFPNGTHVAEVEIDPETGETLLLRYTGVDDYGVVVNPMIAAGQAHGAMAMASDRRCWKTRPTIRNRGSCWRARSWITRCRGPTICPASSSASTGRAARPTRSA